MKENKLFTRLLRKIFADEWEEYTNLWLDEEIRFNGKVRRMVNDKVEEMFKIYTNQVDSEILELIDIAEPALEVKEIGEFPSEPSGPIPMVQIGYEKYPMRIVRKKSKLSREEEDGQNKAEN